MNEFKHNRQMFSEEAQIRAAAKEAGIWEIYQLGDWEHLGNFHTDFIGSYAGDDLAVIPVNAEVRWRVMDAEDYAESLLANCSGNAADYVCEDTGKVLVVQFYVSDSE